MGDEFTTAPKSRSEKLASSAVLTVLARFLLIAWSAIGGPVAVVVLVAGLNLGVELRDAMRDHTKQLADHEEKLKELTLTLRSVERRQDMDFGRIAR